MEEEQLFVSIFKDYLTTKLPVNYFLFRSVEVFKGVGFSEYSAFHDSDCYIVGVLKKPISNLI